MLIGSNIADGDCNESKVAELGRTVTLVGWELGEEDQCDDESTSAEMELGGISVG